MYLIYGVLLCFCCVLNIVYCEDETPFFMFFITADNAQLKCTSTKEVLKIREGQRLHMVIVTDYNIYKDKLIIKKVQEGSVVNRNITGVDRLMPTVTLIKSDRVNKSMNGAWRITASMDNISRQIVNSNQRNYTKVICAMNIAVTEAAGFICQGQCITIWIASSVLMFVAMIAETGLILFWKYKANRNQKYAQLSTMVDKSNENDSARYCGAPGQKPDIANDRDSSRESGIYEALEPMQMSRRPPIPEPPQLETLPRPPKPIPMTILREPLPEPPPITSSLLRPSTNNNPTSLTRNKNKPPVPMVIEDENTYEPPPNYVGSLPNASPESERKKPTSTILKMENTKQTLTKKQKEQKIPKEQPRTSFERIKERPPMPIPAEVQANKEAFKETKSSSTTSLLRNAESKITSTPTASLARNAVTQKLTFVKKSCPPKQSVELKEDTTARFTKPKPQVSLKPLKLSKPDNVTNDLNDVLKKSKDKPDNAADELLNVLKKRKEISAAVARNDNGPTTPSAEQPRKIASPTLVNINNKTSPSLSHNPGPTPGSSGPVRAPAPKNETPVVREAPPIPIHVEGVNYDEHTQSSDDEWTYEPLENYNIYSN